MILKLRKHFTEHSITDFEINHFKKYLDKNSRSVLNHSVIELNKSVNKIRNFAQTKLADTKS